MPAKRTFSCRKLLTTVYASPYRARAARPSAQPPLLRRRGLFETTNSYGYAIMKATVIVTLKPTVLDPQGMTIHRSLAPLGLTDITDVRQGKIFHLQFKDGNREQVERLAKEVLTNPVIEEYRVIWE